AFVVDVFSRKIVGVATRSTMRTDALPMEALEHALTTAGRIHGDARRYLVPVGRYRVPTGADIGYRG
ncbi:hypothetical protein ACOI9P_13885, partial [Corynebacterium striatum]